MKYDVLVVGSGLAGATSAALISEKGYKVLVIEKNKNIAGQCFDYQDCNGITIHKHGPHIFHTKNKVVWDFVNRFSEFNTFQHRVLSYADGDFIEFPINRITIGKVFGIHLNNDEVLDFLKSEVEKSTFNTSIQSFRDAVVSQVGERLYSLFFEQYTKKQWNIDPEHLAPWLAGRIPVRTNNDSRYFTDPYQGLPQFGYTKLVEKMLSHPNIHILIGCDYFAVKNDIQSDLTIYTGELDKFFDYQFGKLTYRSVNIDFKTFDTDSFQPAPVVNYPNDYDWTRITEFKKMTGEKSSKTTVCFEYPASEGIPFYTVPNKENNERKEQYMSLVKKCEDDGNLLFIGRLAEYKYYNMDQVIEAALNKVNNRLLKM